MSEKGIVEGIVEGTASRDLTGSAGTSARSREVLQVEADIARTREQVSRSVMALRKAVAKRTDWREWVRRRPGLFLATAFAVGVIWGSRSRGRAGERK